MLLVQEYIMYMQTRTHVNVMEQCMITRFCRRVCLSVVKYTGIKFPSHRPKVFAWLSFQA